MAEMTFKDFLRDVNNIYKKNCAVYYKLASYYGLTETMFDILYFVRENEDCTTQAQICNNLYLRKQTVNTALKKLEKEGCIYLEKDVGNRKNKTIHFTEKGNELVRNTVDHVFEVERRAFEKLSEEEKKGVLYYGLRHVNVLADETEKFLTEEKNLTE